MKWSQCINNVRVLGFFCRRQLYLFFSDFLNTMIDVCTWPALTAAVFGYVFPYMGMDESYGSFALIGAVVAVCFYVAFEHGIMLINDFDSTRQINFQIGLPVSTPFLIFKNAITLTLDSFLLSAALPFLGKLLLWNRFDMSKFSLSKFFIIFVLLNITFNFFSMCMAGFIKSKDILHFRVRVIDVLFFSGCFLFPWLKLYQANRFAAYLMLLNPVSYATEGMRHAFFGSQGSLSLEVCAIMLILFSISFFFIAVFSWKKRLDYVPLRLNQK